MSKYTPGDWHVICDVCGKKTPASEIKRRWDGMLVCKNDYEHRHPQDFLKAKTDKISVPFSRPRPAVDSFVVVNYYNDYVVGDYIELQSLYVEIEEVIEYFVESLTTDNDLNLTNNTGQLLDMQ